jgi:DNA-binding NarL/FixJ family response regulator
LKADNDPDESAPGSGLSEVPEHLRRIADQIEAARVLAPLAETTRALGIAATTDLSPRQWEIVSRLLQGHRVPTIAAEIYLSPSTVRNHLSVVFAKVGVHSQEELLALYRDHRSDGPSKEQ